MNETKDGLAYDVSLARLDVLAGCGRILFADNGDSLSKNYRLDRVIAARLAAPRGRIRVCPLEDGCPYATEV